MRRVGYWWIALMLLVANGVGCATKSQIAKYRAEGFREANTQCLELQGRIQEYLTSLKTRLAQFETRLSDLRQLDENGELRFGERSKGKAAAEGKPTPSPIPVPSPLRGINGDPIPPFPMGGRK